MADRYVARILTGALFLACAGLLLAGDPDGYSIVSVEWVKETAPSLGPHEKILRVVVRATVPVESAELGFRAPEEISLTARAPGDVPASPGPGDLSKLALGDLGAHQPRSLEFVVRAPPDKSGIAVFSVSGRLLDGREFTEKVSWTVGTPAAPVVRHGAAEYPARIVAEEPR